MNENGFTLVELSIVLVVIGLIVAGVVVGQSLVTQAKFRAITSEVEQYKTTINSFKTKYNEYPGDLDNAHDYWGSACDATPSNCNGDGNGLVDVFTSATDNESFRVWQHLSLADMVSGEYTGEGDTGTDDATIGLNVPESKFSGRGYNFLYGELYKGTSDPATPGHILTLGVDTGSYAYTNNPGFTPAQAYQIDNKVDDGMPIRGNVRGFHTAFGPPVCRSTNISATAQYTVTRNVQECVVNWLLSK